MFDSGRPYFENERASWDGFAPGLSNQSFNWFQFGPGVAFPRACQRKAAISFVHRNSLQRWRLLRGRKSSTSLLPWAQFPSPTSPPRWDGPPTLSIFTCGHWNKPGWCGAPDIVIGGAARNRCFAQSRPSFGSHTNRSRHRTEGELRPLWDRCCGLASVISGPRSIPAMRSFLESTASSGRYARRDGCRQPKLRESIVPLST